MRVLILGSGVIGTTSAWYLRQAGFEVTVLDRQPGPALETSFANAGQLSFGYTSPWAAPGVPKKAIGWLFEKHAPLAIRPGMDLAQYRWLWQMLRNCTQERYAINKARMVRMSEYSRDCLNQLRAETGIDYEGRDLGTTQLFRTQQQLDASAQDIEVLAQYGVPYEVLDRAGIVAAEPALAHVDGLVGALRLPRDQTGDCQLFTRRLAAMAAEAGVEFRYDVDIAGVGRQGDRITGVRVDGKLETADHYVVALGSYSPALVAPLGLGPAGVPAERLLADPADHRSGDGTDVHHPGRELQGRGHPLRQPHPGRWHGRSGRLRPVPVGTAPADAGAGGARPVPEGRRSVAR
ncbi:glycine/D-amino acid oxidase-like deaminating enzyme [Stenotrophomonas sp. SORGH_AS321]|nr:glycine/D-amino acid oxidase-like deaminating enzyme [Stenotrophomonas sp. SORGH_AS_0321]